MYSKSVFVNWKYLGSEWYDWIYFYYNQFLFGIPGVCTKSQPTGK